MGKIYKNMCIYMYVCVCMHVCVRAMNDYKLLSPLPVSVTRTNSKTCCFSSFIFRKDQPETQYEKS